MNHKLMQINAVLSNGFYSLLLLVLLSACSFSPAFNVNENPPPAFPSISYPDENIKAADDVDVLYLDDRVKRYLDYHVGRHRTQIERMDSLRRLFERRDLLAIVYDQSKTRTAMEAFQSRRADCLSFSNLFVAMARYARLDARYQDVMIPLDWDLSGDMNILNKHVNVTGRIGFGEEYTMDILPYQNRMTYYTIEISDERARAQYFSNISIEYMQAGDDESALMHLKRAALIDPELPLVWTNAGTIYGRYEMYDVAETFYRYALLIDNENMTAYNNLAALFEKKGDIAMAQYYIDLIDSYRMKNPYYRYQLAHEAYQEGRYNESVEHLRAAVRKERKDERLYIALAKSYFRLGNAAAATSNLEKAREYAIDPNRYESDLEKLANEEWYN